MSTKKVLLVVEDEAPLRNALLVKLRAEGYIAEGTGDGIEGLQRAGELHPDMILMDILMPKMHGIDCMKKIRQENWGKGIPILLLTNFSNDPRAVEISHDDPLCDYMIKSNVTLDEIIRRIQERLG